MSRIEVLVLCCNEPVVFDHAKNNGQCAELKIRYCGGTGRLTGKFNRKSEPRIVAYSLVLSKI